MNEEYTNEKQKLFIQSLLYQRSQSPSHILAETQN